MAALYNILLFIGTLFFSFCVFIVLLRICLQFFRVNVNNPICVLAAKTTNPFVLPLKKLLPRVHNVDLAAVLLLFIIECLKFSFFAWIEHVFIGFAWLALISFTDMLIQVIDLLFYSIIIRVILSWIGSLNNSNNGLNDVLYAFTEPLLGRIRRFLPVIAGFDLSPMVAFIILKVIEIIVVSYLPH